MMRGLEFETGKILAKLSRQHTVLYRIFSLPLSSYPSNHYWLLQAHQKRHHARYRLSARLSQSRNSATITVCHLSLPRMSHTAHGLTKDERYALSISTSTDRSSPWSVTKVISRYHICVSSAASVAWLDRPS